jgi:hypothetical protein
MPRRRPRPVGGSPSQAQVPRRLQRTIPNRPTGEGSYSLKHQLGKSIENQSYYETRVQQAKEAIANYKGQLRENENIKRTNEQQRVQALARKKEEDAEAHKRRREELQKAQALKTKELVLKMKMQTLNSTNKVSGHERDLAHTIKETAARFDAHKADIARRAQERDRTQRQQTKLKLAEKVEVRERRAKAAKKAREDAVAEKKRARSDRMQQLKQFAEDEARVNKEKKREYFRERKERDARHAQFAQSQSSGLAARSKEQQLKQQEQWAKITTRKRMLSELEELERKKQMYASEAKRVRAKANNQRTLRPVNVRKQ